MVPLCRKYLDGSVGRPKNKKYPARRPGNRISELIPPSAKRINAIEALAEGVQEKLCATIAARAWSAGVDADRVVELAGETLDTEVPSVAEAIEQGDVRRVGVPGVSLSGAQVVVPARGQGAHGLTDVALKRRARVRGNDISPTIFGPTCDE